MREAANRHRPMLGVAYGNHYRRTAAECQNVGDQQFSFWLSVGKDGNHGRVGRGVSTSRKGVIPTMRLARRACPTPSFSPRIPTGLQNENCCRLALQVEEPDTLDNVLELGLKQEERSKNSKNIGENSNDLHGVREVSHHETLEVSCEISKSTDKLLQEDCKEVDQSPKKAMEETKNSENVASDETAKEKGSLLKSMQLKSKINVLKSNIENIKRAYHELFDSGMPGTMAALEAVVRERLGLAWMRRGRKAEPAA